MEAHWVFVYFVCVLNAQKKTPEGFPMSFVGGIGLEPTAFAMSTQCSNQLS